MNCRMLSCIVLLALAAGPVPAPAQAPTNMEIYQQHAVACLASVPGSASAFTLGTPDVMTYLETALVTHWTEAGVAVFRTDSLLAQTLPSLMFSVDEARVSYAAARRKRLARTVSLALHYSWTSRTGRIVNSERCTKSREDVVLRSEAAQLAAAAHPETTAALPPAGWSRRYLEPMALGAATVLTVYLFFNLRSSRGSSGG